jgi:1-acyl-sn-glycerol-3-phosphate acyltransferase
VAHDENYDRLLATGRALYPGLRIGRPARARSYWATIAALRVLRLRWKVEVTGADRVAPGAAILVGNHVSALDPVVAVMSTWWRVTAFTKSEVFGKRGAIFFRLMGQIPLRRGDEGATAWAMSMAGVALADGTRIGLYPEGTRSPDHVSLHRLHKRILIPVLTSHPDVPVHAICTTYGGRRLWRDVVHVHISAPLPITATDMNADDIVTVVRDALVGLGDLTYVDEYARDVKARRAAPPAA